LKVKTIVRETNGDIHSYFPLSTTLKDEGIKKPDQFTATYKINNIVKEGFNISYIQDVTDVDDLGGIWNFQLSALDEGGYDEDPITDPDTSHFVTPDTGKYMGFYAANFTIDGVTDIVIDDPGSGFDNASVIVAITGDGVGATAFATVNEDGGIENITVTNSGQDYSSATVTISGGGGSGATADATITTQGGIDIANSNLSRLNLSKQFDIFVSFTPSRLQDNDGSDEPIVWSHFDSPTGLEIGITGDNGDDDSWRAFARVGNGSLVTTMEGQNQLIMRDDDSENPDPIIIRVYRGQDNIIRMEVNGEEDDTLNESASLQPSGEDLTFGDRSSGSAGEYIGLIHQVRNYSGNVLLQHQADNIRSAKPIPFSLRFRGKIWKTKDNIASTSVKAQSDAYELLTGTLGADEPDQNNPTEHDLTSESYLSILQSGATDVALLNTFTVKAKDSFAFVDTTVTPFDPAGKILEIGSFMDFASILLAFSNTVFLITSRNVIIVETKEGKQTNFVFEQNDSDTSTPNIAAPYNITTDESNDVNLANDITLISSRAGKIRRFYSPNDIKRALRKNVEQLDDNKDLDNYASRLRFNLSDSQSSTPLPNVKHIVKITGIINSVRHNQIVNVINAEKNIDVNEEITQITVSFPSEHVIINTGEFDIDYFDRIEKTVIKSDELVDSTLS